MTERNDRQTEEWGLVGHDEYGFPVFPGSEELWPSGKHFRFHPRRAVAEWERAVDVLDALVQVGVTMGSDPIVLALVEAKTRARQELSGAREQFEEIKRRQ